MKTWRPDKRSGWGSGEEGPRASSTQVLRAVLQVVPGGVIRAGKTAYSDDTHVGFWLGVDTDGLGKLNLGGATAYVKWTGSALQVAGSITAGTITGTVAVVGGEITWADGDGVMDADGVSLPMSQYASAPVASEAFRFRDDEACDNVTGGLAAGVFYDEEGLPAGNALRVVLYGQATHAGVYPDTSPVEVEIQATNGHGDLARIVVSAGVGVNINGVRLCMESARITEVGDADADTDALNRRTGDGRYVGLPASPERGDILFFNGSAWTRLAHGTAGQVLTSGGHGADPYWA